MTGHTNSRPAAEEFQRLKLTVSYVGTNLCGFQLQAEDRTVQGELEAAFARLTGQTVRVHGAGRTDAGVHALAQVAHVDVPAARATGINWRRALNAVLPDDISVSSVLESGPDFHARFSAVGKTYAYRLWCEREYVPPALRPFVWDCGPLNLPLMKEAAGLLTGTHDYASFQNQGSEVRDTVRTVHAVTCCRGTPQPALSAAHLACFSAAPASADCPEQNFSEQDWPKQDWPEYIWEFSANGFLKQMVRNLMGLLVAVGREKIAPGEVPAILEAQQRQGRILTAPAQGLVLLKVHYPDENP